MADDKDDSMCGAEIQGPSEPHQCIKKHGHDEKHLCHCAARWDKD